MKKIILVMFVLFTAATAALGASWQGPYEVGMIEASDNAIYFFNPEKWANPDNCSSPKWVKYTGNTENNRLADRALTIGLTALAKGWKIKVYMNGCSDGGNNGYIKADIIQIAPASTW